MKLIVKIEIVILMLVLLAGAGMVLVSEGVLELMYDPVIAEYTPEPIPTEAVVAVAAEEQPEMPAAEESPQDAEPDRNITAARYFAYDVREGEFLKMKGDGDKKLYPASITKLLTAHTLLKTMDPGDKIYAGDAMTLVQWDSSVAGLAEGDTLTVEQLIAAMMLPSGNDAAQVAAAAAGRKLAGKNDLAAADAVAVFVKEMNKEAKALGMENSHFVTPDGFHDEKHYTTMKDLVKLAEVVLANETITKYASDTAVSVKVQGRTLDWKNTNHLLHKSRDVHMPNAIGLKTGYTSKAGNCLLSAFFMEDRILLIGVFGCPSQTEDRYLDTVAIYNCL